MSEVKGEFISEQEKELYTLIWQLVKKFDNYDRPRIRTDGDIVIPLEACLKKNREAARYVAEAFSGMMKNEVKPNRSKTWVD